MTHPERKAVSDERERLLRASENWRDFMRNVHDGSNEWRYSDERRLLADLLSIETMLRADAEKDETIADLSKRYGALVLDASRQLNEKDETIRRLREAMDEARDALDDALGDTDPCIDDEATDDDVRDEQPVFWACQKLSRALAATASPAPDTKDGVKS